MGKYQVVVGNVGTVYDGNSQHVAETSFQNYSEVSASGVGRAGGEGVVLFTDHEPTKEFKPRRVIEASVMVTLRIDIDPEVLIGPQATSDLNVNLLGAALAENVTQAIERHRAELGFSHRYDEVEGVGTVDIHSVYLDGIQCKLVKG